MAGAVETIAAVANAIAAMAAAGIAWRLHQIETRRHAPSVRVTAQIDHNRPTLILIVIENTGESIARNVRFRTNRAIPKHAFGMEVIPGKKFEEMHSGPLVDGIPALGSGDRRIITWGQWGGLSSVLGHHYIEVTAIFEDEMSETYESQNILEVASFEDSDISGRDPALRAATATEKLARAIESVESEMSNATVALLQLTEKRR